MLFGEFDDVPGTDVAAVLKAGWSYSSGSTSPWARLNRKLTFPDGGPARFRYGVAADFNGDGKSDIAFSTYRGPYRGPWEIAWVVSFGGRGPLTTLRTGRIPYEVRQVLIGRFDAGIQRDQAVSFDRTRLYLSIWRGLGNADAFLRLSTQPMR